MTPTSPFHEGEQRIQARLGVRDTIEPWARRIVRPFLPKEHREFYAQLPFLVVAARDSSGRPWATLLAEEPGFVSSPDPSTLRIATLPSGGDALAGALQAGEDVGLLGIELHTRRRNRVNGRVSNRASDGVTFAVDQSFGNCPQYITERSWRRSPSAAEPGAATRDTQLSRAQQQLIQRADTFFIATGFRGAGDNPAFGMDASHRGGDPGFVRIDGASRIVFPDFAGNNHFNTLGNLIEDPRAGLVFVDFERGDLLQLTGHVRIDWDSADIERVAGARRLVHFRIDEVRSLEGALPLCWDAQGGVIRELRLTGKHRESADVTSFLFGPRDGGTLPGFAAGQHLPIELDIPGSSAPVRRTYSLSGPPGGSHLRISVKRDPLGLASRHLHDGLAPGAVISASMPQGSFTLEAGGTRPLALVSAGVGLTPFVSMLHSLAGGSRPVWFVHGARDGDHHPLKEELTRLSRSSPNIRLHVAYSRPRPQDSPGHDFEGTGRLDVELLERLVPGLMADFYLCGPQGFMAAIEAGLESRGVDPERIHSESFGPGSG